MNTDSTVTSNMNSVSQVLEKLRIHNMDNEFRWTKEGFSANRGKIYQPEDLVIVQTFRFEGASDPSDTEILYIIRANDGLIGYSLDAYGVYSSHENDPGYDNFIRLIPSGGKGHEEQLLFEL